MEDSAKIFLSILEGKGTIAQNSAVIANSGMALYCADQSSGLQSALLKAKDTLESGQALQAFKKLLDQ